MTKLFFFIKQFFNTIKNNKIIYLVFTIAITISSAVLIYLYSLSNENAKDQLENNLRYRTIIVELSESPDPDAISELFRNRYVKIDNISFFTSIDNKINVYGEIVFPAYHNYSNDFPSDEDISESKNVISVSYLYPQNNSRDYVELNGVEYKIKGQLSYDDTDTFYIPYTTFLKNFKTHSFNIELSTIFTKDQLSSIPDILNKAGIKYTNVLIPAYDERIQAIQLTQLTFVVLIYIVTLINFLYMFYYILSKRKKQISIFRITGMSRRGILCFILLEMTGLFSFAYCIGAILSKYVLTYLLNMMWDIPIIDMYVSDILVLFFVMLIITLIAVLLLSARFLRSSISNELKESEHE